MSKFSWPAGKWVTIGLTASLALNLFLGGIFIARWFNPRPFFGFGGGPAAIGDRSLTPTFDRMASRLPPEERARFRAAVDANRDRIAAAAAASRDARRKVRDALLADQVDRPALEASLSDLRARSDEFTQASQKALVEAAATLPLEARRRLLAPPGRTGGPGQRTDRDR